MTADKSGHTMLSEASDGYVFTLSGGTIVVTAESGSTLTSIDLHVVSSTYFDRADAIARAKAAERDRDTALATLATIKACMQAWRINAFTHRECEHGATVERYEGFHEGAADIYTACADGIEAALKGTP